MKSVFFATMLAAVSAFAYPAVNDTATFAGTMASVGAPANQFAVTLSLVGYNPTNDQFTMEQTVNFSGQAQVNQIQVQKSSLVSEAMAQYMVANCVENGGVNETLTVPAGTFNTCKMTESDTESEALIYIADVTFGLAKQVTTSLTSGTVTTLELQSHKSGQ